jgi:glycosyltransferase 2 family protein
VKNGFDLKFWVGIAVSAFFMTLLLKGMDFKQLGVALCSVDYQFVLLAVVFTFISYFLRAVRWRYLLISEKNIPLTSLYPATIIGYMANNLLPARLGEFIRAYVLAEREGLETPTVFASLVIDRLCDGFTVLLILMVTLFTLHLPQGMVGAEQALKVGGLLTFLLYSVVLLFLFLLKRRTMQTLSFAGRLLKPFPKRFSDRIIPMLGSFVAGIRISARGGHVCAILASSLLIWTFCVLPVDMILQGFGIHLPITASMFILVMLVFAVMIPASPGYIGTYHYACFKGLSLFGIAEPISISIALLIHGTSFFPVIIAGFFHLWSGKLSFGGVRNAGEEP